MKDKRKILKIASLFEFIYVLISIFYYLSKGKINEEVIANSFLLLINLLISIVIFKESNKGLKDINKSKIFISGFIL